MKLCDKCGILMMPQKDGAKTLLVCKKCGKSSKTDNISPKAKASGVIHERILHDLGDVIPVVGDKASRILPITKIDCPECKHTEAVWWTQQTRSSDEPETRFYRCTSCQKTWREYS